MGRTNPFAENANAVKLVDVKRIRGQVDTGFDVVITSAGALTTITPVKGHAAPVPRYYKFIITDKSENEAFGGLGSLAIDTSNLNPSDDWSILFSTEQNKADGGAQVMYSVAIPVGMTSRTVEYLF